MVGTDQIEAAIEALHNTLESGQASTFNRALGGPFSGKMREALAPLGVSLEKGTNGTGGGSVNAAAVIKAIKSVGIGQAEQTKHKAALDIKKKDLVEAAAIRTSLRGAEQGPSGLDLRIAFCALSLVKNSEAGVEKVADDEVVIADDLDEVVEDIAEDVEDVEEVEAEEAVEEIVGTFEMLCENGGVVATGGSHPIVVFVSRGGRGVGLNMRENSETFGRDQKHGEVLIKAAQIVVGYGDDAELHFGRLVNRLVLAAAIDDPKCKANKGREFDKIPKGHMVSDADYEQILLEAMANGELMVFPHPGDGHYLGREQIVAFICDDRFDDDGEVVPNSAPISNVGQIHWSCFYRSTTEKAPKKERKTLGDKATLNWAKQFI